jgi:2-keto-4-pentenoate hydratase/2-oxohepta-3-ene-1,7-dioic acid hydratase in catechol pathway
MNGYRLLTYATSAGSPQAGILVDDRIHAAAPLLGSSGLKDAASVHTILHHWDRAHSALRDAAASLDCGDGLPLDDVTLRAPLQAPGELVCAGANYWDHLREMADIAERTTGKRPSMTKPAEPELGVVIGRATRNISEERALDAVAGYTIVNDLSARDLMKREGTPFIYDWIGQKCFEHSAPMGPWITPAEYVGDAENLSIKLWVNGVLKQDSNTKHMVHNAREQIAYLSRHFTLHPGDIIATGTPAGVGMPRGEFLKTGDEVRIEIENCGVLVNRMIGE